MDAVVGGVDVLGSSQLEQQVCQQAEQFFVFQNNNFSITLLFYGGLVPPNQSLY